MLFINKNMLKKQKPKPKKKTTDSMNFNKLKIRRK